MCTLALGEVFFVAGLFSSLFDIVATGTRLKICLNVSFPSCNCAVFLETIESLFPPKELLSFSQSFSRILNFFPTIFHGENHINIGSVICPALLMDGMAEDGKDGKEEIISKVHSRIHLITIESKTEETDQEDECGCQLYCHVRSIRSVSSEANGKESIDRNNENTIRICPADSVPSAPNSMPASQGQLANLKAGGK